MGRKRNVYVREFFHFDTNKNISTCKSCGFEFYGSYATNLKRHVVKNHAELYENVMKKNDQETNQVSKKLTKFSVKFSAEQVNNACVQLVTKEALAFSILDSNAFKVLTDQIFKGLHMPTIHSRNIMDYVSQKYENIQKHIKKLCRGKLISLKMDTATRLDRSVLGINVQFIEQNNIRIYTLAVKELNGKHTGEYLKNELINVLKDFDIDKKQIYCITTDNGRNMLKAVQILSNEYESIQNEEDIHTEEYTETLMENIFNQGEGITSIKCAAHTLQLAVKDFLSQIDSEIIPRAREIVKALRTPTMR